MSASSDMPASVERPLPDGESAENITQATTYVRRRAWMGGTDLTLGAGVVSVAGAPRYRIVQGCKPEVEVEVEVQA